MLGAAHIFLAVGELAEGPAGEDLLQRAVPDRRRQTRIDVVAKLTRLLALLDDPLERLVGKVDLVGLLLHLRAARHLSDEHAYQLRVALPGSEHDLGHLPHLLPRRLVELLH